MKEIDYSYYNDLRNGPIPTSKIPDRVINSLVFHNLLEARIIEKNKSGRGSEFIVKKQDAFEAFFKTNFPKNEASTITKSSNIKKLRGSKARKTESPSIFFIRGFKKIELNNSSIDLNHFTLNFGFFGTKNPNFETDKICFVENLDTFLNAERLLGKEFIFLHKYGRIGVASIKNIMAKEVLVFVDYDFNGLDEYLRIKSVYQNANLYIPKNFVELFDTYSKSIDGKQKQSNRVLESKLIEVIQIRELVTKTNHFLEQEVLI